MKARLFPGQGSQAPQMCSDIYHHSQKVRDFWEHASSIVGFDFVEKIIHGTEKDLQQTSVTQPALFVASFSVWLAMQEKGCVDAEGCVFAGHSVGEYVAAVVCGCLGVDDALRLLAERGRLMESCSVEGGLLAVLGGDQKVVQSAIEQSNLEGCSIALYNAVGQYVVGGPTDELQTLQGALKQTDGVRRVVELSVSGPFHTPHMKEAQERFQKTLEKVSVASPNKMLISSVTGQVVNTAEQVRNALEKQIVAPVLWTEVVRTLAGLEVSEAIEVGPGSVLKGLTKRGIECIVFTKYQDVLGLN